MQVAEKSFHVFSEASEDAYAAVMRERNVHEKMSVSVSSIASKSKVAPLNVHSTPQLELLGATLGLYLCQVVSKILGDHVMKKFVFCCGSMNVMYWIKKFKSFLANQIAEIHTATEPTQWNFVNGRINPADIGSRGMDIVALSGCSTWWNGPEFLLGNKSDWPEQKFELAEKSDMEFKNTIKTCMVSVTCQTVPDQEWRLHLSTFSNWKRLLRVPDWVKRFIQNTRSVKEQHGVGH